MLNHQYTETKLSTADLHQRIYRLYDHLYANAPVRTPAGIATEVGKILHTAMYMEQSRPRMFEDLETAPAFTFDKTDLRRLIRCDDSLCSEVAQEVRQQFALMNKAWKLYEPNTHLNLKDSDIAYTCGQLNHVLVSDKNRDVFGDALEVFRGQWAKRESGQFFTDQRVTSLAMTLLDFDPRRGDDLVDLCAGTGGFLLAGLNRIRTLLERDNAQDVETKLVDLATASLKGREIDGGVCEIANATLISRLSKLDKAFVSVGDSLGKDFLTSNGPIKHNTHLCAATNPPFGTKITIKDENILRNYDLAITNDKLSNRAPDTLFIEQNVRILKPGVGRLAIVVPYQIMSGPQASYIREWILLHTHILAVIDLPADTFQPHTGTKASLLVVKRRAKPLSNINETEDTSVFMSMPRWIGHDRRGNPVYRRAENGTITGEILSDFDQVAQAFEAFKRGEDPQTVHAQSFVISTKAITKDSMRRINALFHRPNLVAVAQVLPSPSKTEWRYVQIKDVVKHIFYPTRFKRNYVDWYPNAVPFLGGSNISQLIINSDKWLRHDDSKLDELRVHAGWILVTRSGSTGIVSSVPAAWDGFAMSEHVIRIVPDPAKLEPEYLHTFLRTRYAQEALAKGVFGSVIDEITPEFIGSIEMPIPTSKEVFDSIVEKAKRAQNARNVAIQNLLEAVEEINISLLDQHPTQ